MIYTSVAQIFENIEQTRDRLYSTVGELSSEQQASRPAADRWSATDIVEHLAIMEDRLGRMMKVMLTKAESASTPSSGVPVQMEPFSLDRFIERARDEKFTAPEAVRPSGKEGLSALLEKLRNSREDLHALRTRIEAIDLSTTTYPHPAFGPLNFYQWLAFIGIHEERHLAQLKSTVAA